MKNFYFEWSSQKQRSFQLQLGIYSLFVIAFIAGLMFLLKASLLYLLPFVVAAILSVIAPFFDIPALVKEGKLKYYSLFLLGEKENKGVIKLHGGSLFDYYFVFQKELGAEQRTKLVLLEFLKGLKQIIKQEKDEVVIEGSSYILNERSARKAGLTKVPMNQIQALILVYNYLNLTVSMSLVKKRFSLPKLSSVNTFKGTVKDLKNNEAAIDQLISRLEKSSASKNTNTASAKVRAL